MNIYVSSELLCEYLVSSGLLWRGMCHLQDVYKPRWSMKSIDIQSCPQSAMLRCSTLREKNERTKSETTLSFQFHYSGSVVLSVTQA